MLRCSSRMRRESRRTVYVVEQPGRVIRLRAGRRTVFLDIRNRVEYGGEQGLLGLAFDPGYASNRRFYVAYTSRTGRNTVERFRSDGAKAVPSSRKLLLAVQDPYGNHNGGHLAFGPDGRLYTSIGDGGSGGDPENRSQNMQSQFGKLLRARRLEAGSGLVDRGTRASQSVAVLVRSRDRRSLHRRRRPGCDRGGQLHAAREPRSRELRLGSLRRVSRRFEEKVAGPGSSSSLWRSTTTTAAAASPAATSTGAERARASEVDTSTATTAVAPCGASGSPMVPRQISASSRSGSTASAPSARTRPASSSLSRTAARSTA